MGYGLWVMGLNLAKLILGVKSAEIKKIRWKNSNGFIWFYIIKEILNFLLIPKSLNVLRFLYLGSPFHGRLRELLPVAQLAHRSGPVEFTLETLQRPIDIFSVFYWYN